MNVTAIVNLAVAAAIVIAAPAAAATVSPAGVRFPQAAVNERGATVVAWERQVAGRFAIEARSGAAPLRLGVRRRLADRGFSPQVAIGADATKAIMWMQHEAERHRSIRVAIARPGHRFGRAITVERRRAILTPVDVHVQPGGRVVAVWQRSNRVVRYAIAERGRRFAAARTAGVSAAGATTAVDGRDGAIVVPVAPAPGAQAAVSTLTRSADAFSAPQPVQAIGPSATPVYELEPIAVSGPGGAGVAYVVVGDPRALTIVRRDADGSWAVPERITIAAYRESVFATNLRAAIPTDGSAVAAWSVQVESSGLGSILSSAVAASIAQPSALFGPPQALSPAPARRFSAPSVVASAARAYVAAAESHGAVLLATRAAGATTFATTRLSSDGDGDVMLSAAGRHVIAIYQQDDRLRLKVVR